VTVPILTFNVPKLDVPKKHVPKAYVPKLSCTESDLPQGHSLKLYMRHCRLDARKFFSQRVVNSWNSLPQHVIEAPSVNSFKKRLDDYYQDIGLF